MEVEAHVRRRGVNGLFFIVVDVELGDFGDDDVAYVLPSLISENEATHAFRYDDLLSIYTSKRGRFVKKSCDVVGSNGFTPVQSASQRILFDAQGIA